MRGLIAFLVAVVSLAGISGCGGQAAVTPSKIGKADALGDPVKAELPPK
jgi:hypothetical protein